MASTSSTRRRTQTGQAVLKAAAFEIAGQLERFVLLLAGRTLLESPAVLVNRIWRRFKAAAENRTVHRWSAAQFDVAPWTEPKGPADRLVPVHTSTFYQRRIPRYPSSSDYWYTDAANPKECLGSHARSWSRKRRVHNFGGADKRSSQSAGNVCGRRYGSTVAWRQTPAVDHSCRVPRSRRLSVRRASYQGPTCAQYC
jgi:hypothetical protein